VFENKKILTLVSSKKNIYSSFPTVVVHKNEISLFFRQGKLKAKTPHGYYGKVKKNTYNLEEFLSFFKKENYIPKKNEKVVFEGDNELDAIVSKLEDNLFSLGTREYIKGSKMTTYLSVSDSPEFKDRMEIKIKGTQWVIFYGKAFKGKEGYIFTAYGPLTKDTRSRPLVLITDDFRHWEILSCIENKTFLNESSITFVEDNYHIFMRENENIFGIWHSLSNNLEKWSKPKKLFPNAHAPMAFNCHNEIFVSFRDIVSEEKACLSLYNLENKTKIEIDSYKGNIYDGGYSDPILVDDKLFVFYYLGNIRGEPEIKCILMDIIKT